MLKGSIVTDKSYILKYTILLIISLLITKYVYELSIFVKHYKTSFDFGKMLKNVCHDEYFESESHRFEIAKNQEKFDKLLKISDVPKFIVFIMILISLFFILILASLSINLFINLKYINEILGNSFPDDNNIFATFFQFILPHNLLQIVIVTFQLLFSDKFLLAIFIMSALFLIIYIIFLYPYKIYTEVLSDVFNININYFKKFPDNTPIFTIGIFLIMMRLIYFFIDKNEDGSVTNYLKDIKLYLSDDIFGFIVYSIAIFAYIMIFDFLKYLTKDNHDDIQKDGVKKSSFFDYIKTVWGINTSSKISSFILSGIGFTIFIQIVWMFVIKDIEYNQRESNAILFYIMASFLVLIVFIVIQMSGNTYNQFVLHNIVSEPIKIYKQHFFSINKEFNKIIDYENEKFVDSDNSVNICRNVGNAILCVLYSHLFHNISGSEIDVTPEFKYTQFCEKISYDFQNDKIYDIMYYIKQKGKEQHILYDPLNCSKLNDSIVYQLNQNIDKLSGKILNQSDKYEIWGLIISPHTSVSMSHKISIVNDIINRTNNKDSTQTYDNSNLTNLLDLIKTKIETASNVGATEEQKEEKKQVIAEALNFAEDLVLKILDIEKIILNNINEGREKIQSFENNGVQLITQNYKNNILSLITNTSVSMSHKISIVNDIINRTNNKDSTQTYDNSNLTNLLDLIKTKIEKIEKEQVIEEALKFAEDLVLKIFETSNTALNIIREKKIESSGSQILVEKSNEHLKNKITSAIMNVLTNRLYYDNTDFFTVKGGDNKNNKLVNIDTIYEYSQIDNRYDNVIDLVVDEYKQIRTNDDVEKTIQSIIYRFQNINAILSKEYVLNEKAKITNYTISNYNNVNLSNPYDRRSLEKIMSNIDVQYEVFDDINDFLDTSFNILNFLENNTSPSIYDDRRNKYAIHINDVDNIKGKLINKGIQLHAENTYSTRTFKNILGTEYSEKSEEKSEEIITMKSDITKIQELIDEYKLKSQNDIEQIDRNLSLEIHQKAIESDRLIYLVILNYIIAIAITNIII